MIDVVAQKDYFDHYHSLKKWSEQTKFLRSIVKREPVKQNFNQRVSLKKKDFHSSYYLTDANGQSQRVCSDFVERVLQINRAKLYRASTSKNPDAVDFRGKK